MKLSVIHTIMASSLDTPQNRTMLKLMIFASGIEDYVDLETVIRARQDPARVKSALPVKLQALRQVIYDV